MDLSGLLIVDAMLIIKNNAYRNKLKLYVICCCRWVLGELSLGGKKRSCTSSSSTASASTSDCFILFILLLPFRSQQYATFSHNYTRRTRTLDRKRERTNFEFVCMCTLYVYAWWFLYCTHPPLYINDIDICGAHAECKATASKQTNERTTDRQTHRTNVQTMK